MRAHIYGDKNTQAHSCTHIHIYVPAKTLAHTHTYTNVHTHSLTILSFMHLRTDLCAGGRENQS